MRMENFRVCHWVMSKVVAMSKDQLLIKVYTFKTVNMFTVIENHN
jgi:hypothetical protein